MVTVILLATAKVVALKSRLSPNLSESDLENIDSLASTQILPTREASTERKKRKTRETQVSEKSIKNLENRNVFNHLALKISHHQQPTVIIN